MRPSSTGEPAYTALPATARHFEVGNTFSSAGVRTAIVWRDRLVFAYLQEPPFCFRDSDGAERGCDVELAQVLLAMAGGNAFQPVEAEFAQLLRGLVDGRWMMTTGLFVTDERRARIDFSRPIWALHDGLLVRAANPRGIAGYGSLALDGSGVLGVIVEQGIDGAPGVIDRIRLFETQDEAAEAVANGHVDAYASVAAAHRGYLVNRPDAPLAVVDVPIEEAPTACGAFAFGKDSQGLRDAIDEALGSYLGSPEHRALMSRYGFTAAEVDRVL
jgi:polar amino acid transport system substrate-binding protein